MTPVGPELDHEIATKVFRHVVMIGDSGPRVFLRKSHKWVPIQPYSTSEASAQVVVQHYEHLGWRILLNIRMEPNSFIRYLAEASKVGDLNTFVGEGSTTEEAICRAALELAQHKLGE